MGNEDACLLTFDLLRRDPRDLRGTVIFTHICKIFVGDSGEQTPLKAQEEDLVAQPLWLLCGTLSLLVR